MVKINQSIFRSTLIGVTSLGTGCANPDLPGVYARVTELKSWIQDNAPGTQDSNCVFNYNLPLAPIN